MGMMDRVKDQSQDAAGEHGDKLADAFDKAEDVANEKTGAKHAEQIDKGVERGKDAVEDFGR